jgi:hypothetical protein
MVAVFRAPESGASRNLSICILKTMKYMRYMSCSDLTIEKAKHRESDELVNLMEVVYDGKSKLRMCYLGSDEE